MSDFYNKYPYTDFHELNLDWVIERVKKLTEDWAATLTEWNNTEEEWQQLYDYVHDYFANLDVQQEINTKINQMILDGTFATIATPIIENQVITTTTAWLADHITQPTTPAIDTSLTIAGAAADAKVTGDKFNDTNGMIYSLMNNTLPYYRISGQYINYADGKVLPYGGWSRTDFIPIDIYSRIICKSSSSSGYNAYYTDADENTFISAFTIRATDTELNVPSNAKYIRISGQNQFMDDLTINCITIAADNADDALELIQDGIVDESLTPDFIQKTGENRIWYLPKSLNNKWILSITDPAYDVTTFYEISGSYYTRTWSKDFVIDQSLQNDGIAIRKSDLSNISQLTQGDLVSLVKYYKVEDTNFNRYKLSKYAHYSFDDCVFWTDFIDNQGSYTSIFDNSFLADLKDLHDTYGAVFTLNCFCTSGAYSIASVPSRFAIEFAANKEWLKFAFHAEDSATYYDTDDVAGITASYNTFTTAMNNMCGDLDCIDHVTRLGFFTGTINNVTAIRDADCGITGLLCADDTRISYYLTADQATFLQKHAKMFDATNQLMLFRTQPRIDTVMNMTTYCNQYLSKAYNNQSRYLEFFTHEYNWSPTIKSQLAALFDFLVSHDYEFAFMENVLKL